MLHLRREKVVKTQEMETAWLDIFEENIYIEVLKINKLFFELTTRYHILNKYFTEKRITYFLLEIKYHDKQNGCLVM